MHFFCTQKSLLHSISTVQKAVSSKTTLPILKGIYIEALQDELKLIATDLDIGIEHTMMAKIVDQGSIVVDSKFFGEIIRKLPDAEVEIQLLENNQLKIKCLNTEFNILVYPKEEFPELPIVGEDNVYTIPNHLLKNMIRQTVFATAQEETRPILTGVLMEIEDDKISMVALDGYRLSLRQGSIDGYLNTKVVIPAKTLNELIRILNTEGNTPISIALTDKQALFTIERTKLISRLLDGEFINYKQIIPKEYGSKLTVKTKDLLDSIERASLLAREGKSNLVKFTIRDKKMIINSNSELGKVEERIDILLEGEDLEIAFNAKYFIEVLKVLDDEEIFLEFTTNISPGILRPASTETYTYLVLPVRLPA